MKDDHLIKKVSESLFNLLVVDDTKYGRQQDDGTYRLIREKISVVTIDDMLLHQKSLLVYQELHTVNKAFIKWACIDLDISKKEIDQHNVNEENLKSVLESATQICTYLASANISYLLEFSGRRGFHIWLIFEELESKETGFKLIDYILSQVTLPSFIIADKFPKSAGISKNTKGVGFGVKLPLSQNKASGKLAYFLKDPTQFNINDLSRPSSTDQTFLIEQLSILNDFRPLKKEQFSEMLYKYDKQFELNIPKSQGYFKLASIKLESHVSELEPILASLKKCNHIAEILTDFEGGLSQKQRQILVGLLGRIKTSTEPNLGYKLLLDLFSRIKNFRKDITEQKLKLIYNYFPISCQQLGRCSFCTCNNIDSPIQLIENIKTEPVNLFSISQIEHSIFDKIVNSLKKYTIVNDEIPLYNQLKKIEGVSINEIKEVIEQIFKGGFPTKFEAFEFKRNENDKTRTLYSIDHINNIVSTYLLFVLNNLFYTEISDNSFGYRIAPSFYSNNIFNNWFINWAEFSKKITGVLKNQEFERYYVLKVDIKNFYDRVDLRRLSIKLYEEASPTIACRLSELSEDNKQHYKNIINYFIKLSSKITGNSAYGLPQGPAYARYLAELYLLGLDGLIENELIKDPKREFYYRFVDDIFIFTESEETASHVLKMINRWASLNNLELNNSKTEISSVGDYNKSGKFTEFQNNAKYWISKANKNKAILTEAEIQEALSTLDKLTNDTKFGLKDNIRFFYFQFSGDSRLNYIKEKLLKFLPYSKSGRGALFMMFYSDLYKTHPEDFWLIAPKQSQIFGLSLGHYLNTILFIDELSKQELFITSQLIQAVSLRQDLSHADKALLVTISRKFNLELPKAFLNDCPKSLIYSAMETPEIRYGAKDFDYVEDLLRDKNKEEFVYELYRIITLHPLEKELAEKMASYVITRFSEWRDDQQFEEIAKYPTRVIQYYHCLCFFTLFDTTTEGPSLIAAWTVLLSKSKSIHIKQPIVFEWLSRAVFYKGNEFSRNSYSILLANKDGSELGKFECPNGFLRQFQNILLVLLFSKKVDLSSFTHNGFDLIDHGSRFGKWLDDPNARLYPQKDNICMKNLALNGVIVLENDTHYFFKCLGQRMDFLQFNYLSIDHQFNNEEVEIKKGSVLSVYEKAKSFSEHLSKLSKFIQKSEDFKDEFNTSYPVFYKKPITIAGNPAIPFYSKFSRRISAFGIAQTNDINALWENAEYISNIHNSQLTLVPDLDNPYNFSIAQFQERFFPKSELLMESTQDRVDFITLFDELANGQTIDSIFEFQDLWSRTIYALLGHKAKANQNLIQFLNVHLSRFGKPDDMPLDILFSVNKRCEIENSNLVKFFTTISSSWIIFQSQLKMASFRFSDLIDKEVEILDSFFYDNYNLKSADFIREEVAYKSIFNTKSGKSETHLLLNNLPVLNIPILLFERDPIGFYAKSIDELSIRTRASNVFVAKIEDKILIYIPELELQKAYERISDRKELFLQDASSKYRKLFPVDEIYQTAEKAYEDSSFEIIEKNLGTHYVTNSSIRERIVNWLTIFNEKTIANSKWETFLKQKEIKLSKAYRAILEILEVHQPITEEAIEYFKNKITGFVKEKAILFPLKHPGRDANGLQRLLAKCGFSQREIDFERSSRDFFTIDCSNKELVLLVDTTISGSQFETALNHYLTKYQNEGEFLAKEVSNQHRYFEFHSFQEVEMFRRNMEGVLKISILTPMLTDRFKERAEKMTIFQGKHINWMFQEKLNNYILKDASLNSLNREIVEKLILDHELINHLFITGEDKDYKTSKNDLKKLNLVLRVGSLPSRHISLFSLKPRNGNQPLLDYVKNWLP